MTKPTITYKHGFLTDCRATTEKGVTWVETEQGLDATLGCNGDVFVIEGTCDNAADEYAYYEYDLPTNIKTSLYPLLVIRYKTTEGTAPGLYPRATVVFDDTSTDTYHLPFADNWTIWTHTLPPAEIIDKIQLGADDSPDTLATGTYAVYFDFALICGGVFTWPFSPHEVEVILNRHEVDIAPPGRQGDITQGLGCENAQIFLRGSIDMKTGWHGPLGFDEEYFYQITHEADYDDWQWLTTDRIQCKVRPRHLRLLSSGNPDESLITYEWELREYTTIPADSSNVPYGMRFYNY